MLNIPASTDCLTAAKQTNLQLNSMYQVRIFFFLVQRSESRAEFLVGKSYMAIERDYFNF